ncbi:uracil-DNA glycosylase family protein [Pacificibacter maritimus]|nr:uracil-DNA glycosylase family protein [Pacificibacter maritimus]
MNDLKRSMAGCTLCSDLPLGPRPIFKISSRVKILIAGQAPGRLAHISGKAFDDPSGDRLRRWLGVGREQFYDDPRLGILPMGLCFPGSGARGDLAPRDICAQTWRSAALASMTDIELTIILGKHALAWHLPDQKRHTISQSVMKTFSINGPELVMPHPSPRNAMWFKRQPWFETEMIPRLQQKVRELLD